MNEGKPKVEIQLVNKEIYVDDSAFLTCNVRSYPGAEIFWLYEGKFITNEEQRASYAYSDCNTSLTINFAEARDTGRYSCMARNSHGETTSERVTLLVQQRDKFEKLYKTATVQIQLPHLCDQMHKNITLKCAHNKSKGICTWKRGNNSINTERISYCDDRMCCLTIHDFTKEDADLYTCFMYLDVYKAQVKIPPPVQCDVEDEKNPGGNTGEASKVNNHVGVYAVIGMIIIAMDYFYCTLF